MMKSLRFIDMSVPEQHDHQEESDSICINSSEESMANFEIEEEVQKVRHQVEFKKSSCSTKISDIQGIIFGGISSRFWIYRKHMCSLEYNKLKYDTLSAKKARRTVLPFYSWQCISLQLKNRCIDLVIKNEENMDLFIRLLVISMNTIDGQKNSAEPHI